MYVRSKRGLSYLPQEPSIFRKLSVEDNIRLVVQTRGDLSRLEQEQLVEELLQEFGISALRKQKGYTLSGGERRRTEIARALGCSPRFLLLDEPFAGIDPKAVYEIKQLIKSLSSKGIGILLTDHNVRDTLSITSSSYIINEGSILVSGGKRELLSNRIAREIYFGEDFEGED
jgi:lipopolysaccharide export system ATP-binding protein